MELNSGESIVEQDTEHEESSVTGSDKTTEINCESCFEAFEKERLFQCTTCNDKLEAVDGVKFSCEGCIIAHVRKGHDILDHKSLKPAVCTTHKNLCCVFCTNCEEILCLNCILKHSNHNIMPIEERASQVRSEVFELLSDLDSSEKTVRLTKERLNKQKETRKKGFEQLVQDVSSAMDVLKQNVLDRIKAKNEKTLNMEQESTENYELLLHCQSGLRELLSCSEGHMVELFKEKKQQVAEVKKKAEELKLCKIMGSRCSIAVDTSQLVDRLSDELARNIEIPSVEKRNEDCYVYSKMLGDLYSVKRVGNEIIVYEFKFEDHKDGVRMLKNKLAATTSDDLHSDIQAFFLMEFRSSPTILIKASNFAYVFFIEEKSFRKIKLNLESHQIPLFFALFRKDVAEFVYWDKVKKTVRQTNNQSVEYKCESLPRIVNACEYDTFVHFVNEVNEIVEIEAHAFFFLPYLS